MFLLRRNHLGIPGVISVVALVFAMIGGAFAATGGLSGKQKNEVKAIAKRFQGTGPAGPTGPQGPAGANGKDGANGAPGKDGVSVTSEEFAGTKEGHCAGRGGSKLVSASGATFACNGKDGQTGFTETLPPGKTETGVWTFGPIAEGAIPDFSEGALPMTVPISFPIPLAAPLDGSGCQEVEEPCRVHFINAAGKEVNGFSEEVDSTACTGSVAAPTATPGDLCIYTGSLTSGFVVTNSAFIKKPSSGGNEGGADTTGAAFALFVTTKNARGMGTWAVTASEGP